MQLQHQLQVFPPYTCFETYYTNYYGTTSYIVQVLLLNAYFQTETSVSGLGRIPFYFDFFQRSEVVSEASRAPRNNMHLISNKK